MKAIGDAVLLATPAPEAALRLVQRILAGCQDRERFLVTRTGLHHGPAAERSGDFFGTAVNLTARLAAHAGAGQVLGTTSVAAAARDLGVRVGDLGETSFKNVAGPVRIHAVELATAPGVESIDPVCRMRVDHRNAAGYLRHGGSEYWFCSIECAGRFAAEHT